MGPHLAANYDGGSHERSIEMPLLLNQLKPGQSFSDVYVEVCKLEDSSNGTWRTPDTRSPAESTSQIDLGFATHVHEAVVRDGTAITRLSCSASCLMAAAQPHGKDSQPLSLEEGCTYIISGAGIGGRRKA